METSSENINTETNETLSFQENEKSNGRAQYTLNGIVLFLTEKLGRAIGVMTRESQRILSKAGQGVVDGAKEIGKRAKANRTKASKDETEEVSPPNADLAVSRKDAEEDATGTKSETTSEVEKIKEVKEAKEAKESGEEANSKQGTSDDTKASSNSAGRRRKREEEKAESETREEAPSDAEEE